MANVFFNCPLMFKASNAKLGDKRCHDVLKEAIYAEYVRRPFGDVTLWREFNPFDDYEDRTDGWSEISSSDRFSSFVWAVESFFTRYGTTLAKDLRCLSRMLTHVRTGTAVSSVVQGSIVVIINPRYVPKGPFDDFDDRGIESFMTVGTVVSGAGTSEAPDESFV